MKASEFGKLCVEGGGQGLGGGRGGGGRGWGVQASLL